MTLPCIIFDLDGTLADSAPDIRAAGSAVLAEEGARPLTLAETRAFIGNGAAVFVERMIAARGLGGGATTHARLLAAFLARYNHAVGRTRLYPGVAGALAALRARGHVLGLCTNKPGTPTRALLAHLGLAGLFTVEVCGDSLPARKPDPAPLQHCLTGCAAQTGIFVGDSEVDAETAERAGLPFLLFTEGYRKRPVTALRHHTAFDHFAALPGIVAGF